MVYTPATLLSSTVSWHHTSPVLNPNTRMHVLREVSHPRGVQSTYQHHSSAPAYTPCRCPVSDNTYPRSRSPSSSCRVKIRSSLSWSGLTTGILSSPISTILGG